MPGGTVQSAQVDCTKCSRDGGTEGGAGTVQSD